MSQPVASPGTNRAVGRHRPPDCLSKTSRVSALAFVPDGYAPLNEAAKRLGCVRQNVLHKVQRGKLHAIEVTNGRRRGLRINLSGAAPGLLLDDEREEGSVNQESP